jgi:broad specificity phosphatase PhoE
VEVILVRHGESEYNVGVSKHLDSRLTERGREQSRKVAAELAELDLSDFAGIVSPYRRARDTAAIIAEATGVDFEVDELVREWGQTVIIEGRRYEHEPIDKVVERLRHFVEARRGQRLLVVSHGTPVAILTQLARGQEPVTVGEFWADVENCCLRRITPPAAGAGPSSGDASP